jgi:hypothetical protein
LVQDGQIELLVQIRRTQTYNILKIHTKLIKKTNKQTHKDYNTLFNIKILRVKNIIAHFQCTIFASILHHDHCVDFLLFSPIPLYFQWDINPEEEISQSLTSFNVAEYIIFSNPTRCFLLFFLVIISFYFPRW